MLKKSPKKNMSKKSVSRKINQDKVAKKIDTKKSALIKVVKKKTTKKKTALKKTALGKRPLHKTTSKSELITNKMESLAMFTVEPGPASQALPPVEEPSRHEEAIGTVTHYYSHLGVAIVQINKGSLKTGDTVHITGHSVDFTQPVESMEYEHQHIDQAEVGQSIGLRVKEHTREHDIVYLIK